MKHPRYADIVNEGELACCFAWDIDPVERLSHDPVRGGRFHWRLTIDRNAILAAAQ
jgi:hypothetical protein